MVLAADSGQWWHTGTRWMVYKLEDWLSNKIKQDGPVSRFLEGVFEPLKEEPEDGVKLEVTEGALPESLHGAYVRNGANPALPPITGYHLFDGDGMIHALRFKDGEVWYGARYVRTEKLQWELKEGEARIPKIGEMGGGKYGVMKLILSLLKFKLGLVPKVKGPNHTANTSVMYHARKILALGEGGSPYMLRVLCNGIVETLGCAKNPITGEETFTAHPKVDPETKEMVTFCYSFDSPGQYFKIGFLDAEGMPLRSFNVSAVERPVMIHDMAMSKNYAMIFDLPLVFEPKLAVTQLPFELRKELPSRFGLVPRDATSEDSIHWFEDPVATWITHSANAWESPDGKTVTLLAISNPKFELSFDEEVMGATHLHKWVFDLETGEIVCSKPVLKEHVFQEFPVINPRYGCSKNRYVWSGIAEKLNSQLQLVKIGKVDLDLAEENPDAGLVNIIEFPEGTTLGEMFFAPRFEDPSQCDGEDDGFLMGFTWDADLKACFRVFDAKTMSPTPLCSINIPTHVPFGFHGWHLSETEFQNQIKT